MESIFGVADPTPNADGSEEGKDGLESGGDVDQESARQLKLNPYPEPEIDDMRAVRDAALARYIQVRSQHNKNT